jgi:hypothetical protein
MNRLLTPIDKAVVVLRKRLVRIALFLENHRGGALGTALRVKVELDRAQGADGGLEELLYGSQHHVNNTLFLLTLICSSLTSGGKPETMIFWATDWAGAPVVEAEAWPRFESGAAPA